MVLAVVHAGQDRAGPLQATLVLSTDWYLTDDARIALPHTDQMAGRSGDCVVLWLVQSALLTDQRPAPSLWPKDVLVQNAVRALHQKDIHGLCEEEAIQTLLHGYCVICGKKLFSFQCTCEHIQKHHPEYVNELSSLIRA